MRIYEILFENIWSDVATKWSDANNISIYDVTNTINIFRHLANTGKITGTNEKNIQYWSKKLFSEFQSFVDENKHKLETKGTARSKIKSSENEILLDDNDDWLVVIPKDKETSQNLGSGTNWCTSTKTDNNQFDQYTCKDLTTLIYLISKTSKEKYAIRFKTYGKIKDLRNKTNDELSIDKFRDETGYNPTQLIARARNNTKWKEFIKSLQNLQIHLTKKLIKCARTGDLGGVKYCLDNGANIHESDDLAFCVASGNGCIKVVKLLLDHGANVHANDDDAIRVALKNGHAEVVKLLLDHGVDIHTNNDIALRNASIRGHIGVVKLLLDHGNVHALDDALHVTAFNGYTEVVKLLLDHGVDIHTNNDIALQNASTRGHIGVVKLLLDRGANVHALDDWTLYLASNLGHIEVVKLLLAHSLIINEPFSSKNIEDCIERIRNQEVIKLLTDYMEMHCQ